jgi:hypothetical protein
MAEASVYGTRKVIASAVGALLGEDTSILMPHVRMVAAVAILAAVAIACALEAVVLVMVVADDVDRGVFCTLAHFDRVHLYTSFGTAACSLLVLQLPGG